MKNKIAATLLLSFGVAMQAAAELPAVATTAFTSLETDALAMQDLIWAPVVALAVGWVLIRLFKRGARQVG